jgi:hypothetical protein
VAIEGGRIIVLGGLELVVDLGHPIVIQSLVRSERFERSGSVRRREERQEEKETGRREDKEEGALQGRFGRDKGKEEKMGEARKKGGSKRGGPCPKSPVAGGFASEGCSEVELDLSFTQSSATETLFPTSSLSSSPSTYTSSYASMILLDYHNRIIEDTLKTRFNP